MRVLILSCNTGEGHNSAARAIKEYFEGQDVERCDIRDALSFLSPEASKFISKGHVFVYKNTPQLFGAGYMLAEKYPARDPEASLLYDIMKLGSLKLFEELRRGGYDTVISVHVFASLMLTRIQREFNPRLKAYFVATDYSRAPGLESCLADRYCIPHEDLKAEFAAGGLPEERIVATGIPVKPVFYQKLSREKAKESLGLPQDKRLVLLMGGSMGAGPIRTLAKELAERLPADVVAAVICGSNRKLYQAFVKLRAGERLRLIGFTDQVSCYMDAAELLITKPGGLSSTEGAMKRLPMLFVNAVPGCETRNLEFFLQREMAEVGTNPQELAEKTLQYLAEPDRLKRLGQALSEHMTHYGAKEIYEVVWNNRERSE